MLSEREFCYWLQGGFEMSEMTALSTRQTQIIKDHLALVFNKVTPDRNEGKFPLITTPHTGKTADKLCGMQKEPTYCTPKTASEIHHDLIESIKGREKFREQERVKKQAELEKQFPGTGLIVDF